MVHVLLVTLGRAVGLGQVGAAQDWSPCESELTFCGAKGHSREGQCDDSGHCCFLQALPPPLLVSPVEWSGPAHVLGRLSVQEGVCIKSCFDYGSSYSWITSLPSLRFFQCAANLSAFLGKLQSLLSEEEMVFWVWSSLPGPCWCQDHFSLSPTREPELVDLALDPRLTEKM